ncbi:MAG: sulfotransferase [Planctomycetes bacterium]|nr:sulfotransferase [Planctomycetota bacterium]MCP4860318.1 sulfotransferase [Planctomycetota bacterium]
MAQLPSFDFSPVVILGAARSGTNMLRDVLCSLPGAETWPCDEINPVWRHGNLDVSHDAFPPELASASIKRFVRKRFRKQAKRSKATWMVEKTCANTLRVGFIHAILPEARFVHISRDGYDVVPSAMKRWKAPLDLSYTIAKARFVPWTDFPYYLWRFTSNRVARLGKRAERTVSTWGPRFPGMDKTSNDISLEELCARQWQSCEIAANEQLAHLPADQVLSIRYEDFVVNPLPNMQRIRKFLGADWSDEQLAASVTNVRPGSVGNGKRQLSEEQLDALAPFLQPERVNG